MGLRYRKSIKLGKNLKVNINKNSVSFTGGTKGFHHTVSSSGRQTTSANLPGGLSYVKTTNTHPKSSNKKTFSKSEGEVSKQSCGCGCLIIIIIFVALFSLLNSCGNDSSNQTTTEPTTEITTEIETTSTEAEHRPDMYAVSDLDVKDLDSKFNIDDVPNDVTGNWRISTISENIEIEKYAMSYYYTYFKNDSEIHGIVNFDNNTTTRINCMSDMLFVTIYEYVPGEEHDAQILYSGKVYEEYCVYLDNGDIEKLDNEISSQEPDSSSTTASEEITTENVITVWIAGSGNGTKYHSKSSCSNMDNPIEIPLEDAEQRGYTQCKRCH